MSLDLDTSHATDSEAEQRFISIIGAVAYGTTEPALGARDIDTIVTEQSKKAYAEELAGLKVANSEDEDIPPKNQLLTVSGWQSYLWHSLGKAGMAMTTDYPVQDRLICLIQELIRLPKHNLPFIASDGTTICQEELWTLNHENHYRQFASSMSFLHRDFVGNRQIEGSDAADITTRTRYINFASFLARLVGARVINVINLCPLTTGEFLGSIRKTSREREPYIIAATQWIIHAAPVLLELCKNKAYYENFTYGLHRWKQWEAVFVKVAAAPESEFSDEVRKAASLALTYIVQAEKHQEQQQHSTNGVSIIDTFGLQVIEDE